VTEIEIYRGENLERMVRVPLAPFLRAGVERLLGRSLGEQARFQLEIYPVPDKPELEGMPRLINLLGDYGYVNIVTSVGGSIVYRHPHTLNELLGRPLQQTLAEQFPDVTVWGYAVRAPGLEKAAIVRPVPEVEGLVHVDPVGQSRRPSFTIRRLPDPEPPTRSLRDYGISPSAEQQKALVKVILRSEVERAFSWGIRFSDEIEEGGFLAGRIYLDGDCEGTYIAELTTVLPAQHTGASLLHFTFTGDSFGAMSETLERKHPGDALLGWYHTHLFAATDGMGLSSIDVDLHFTTFRRPWQLAGLVNLDGAFRVLRFYARRENTMSLCPQWAVSE
jgi:hypothetical protein